MQKKLLYVTSSLPSLTLTFVYREIAALENLGVEIDIVSMNQPKGDKISSEARGLIERITYLNQVGTLSFLGPLLATLLTHPVRFAKCLLTLVSATPLKGGRDVARLIYHFLAAAYLSRKYNWSKISGIHAHFVSGPSSIAMFLSGLTGVPFSFTMHGSQIYLDPIALGTKLAHCSFVISISEFHRRYVLDTYGAEHAGKFHVIRCGIDMERFAARRDKTKRGSTFTILSVARLVEVKGLEYLLRACAELKRRHIEYDCRIVGDGDLAESLKSLATELGIQDTVHFEGAKLQSELTDYFASADAFCLPCVVASDGGVDGLPVVLMEAMAWELPVVSSDLVGIPELVENRRHGILAKPKDVNGIADALEYIAGHPDEARAWGKNGRLKVAGEFNVAVAAGEMKTLFFDDAAITRSMGETQTSVSR